MTSCSVVDRDASGRIQVDEHGTNLDEARGVLEVAYAGIKWQADLSENPFSYWYASAGDASMTMRHVQFEGNLSGNMPASDDIVITWITRGLGVLNAGADEIEMMAGHARMWPALDFAFRFRNYDQRLVQMNRAAVTALAAEQGITPGALTFDHTADPAAEAMKTWRNSISLISRSVLDKNASPLLQAEMGRLAGLALLELYPQDDTRLPPELLLPKNVRIREAVEHIHDHAHLPLTPAGIAETVGLSARGLQQAFQRLFDMTPHGYIRTVRLDRVRQELLASDPDHTSIGDIALYWGFAHAGRFSAAYVERFGEYPRDTLRPS